MPSKCAPAIYFHFSPLGMITGYIMTVRNETRCSGKKSEPPGEGDRGEETGDEHATRSRRWFPSDMFRPCRAFNFAQKLKWYRPVSGRERSLRRVEIEGTNLWKARRRPAGARQNLNPFKQLPHFAGVYNSWEAASRGQAWKTMPWKTSRPYSKPTRRARARAREFPWKKDSP